MGFWIDLKNPYITYETSYIETLWWIIKEFHKKGLLYEDFKVVPWCPRCQTGLSSHEVGLGYKEVEDTAVYVKFALKPGQVFGGVSSEKTSILAWTTTPWTLPGNIGLAVNPTIKYVRVKKAISGVTWNKEGRVMYENVILAKDIFDSLHVADFKNPLRVAMDMEYAHIKPEGHEAVNAPVCTEINVKDLIGLAYEPLFDVPEFRKSQMAYKIYSADFVSATEGTGVVHTAVMYGEDDYRLGN